MVVDDGVQMVVADAAVQVLAVRGSPVTRWPGTLKPASFSTSMCSAPGRDHS